MAEPMSANEFLAALKAEGVPVRERAGWKTHNRNSKGKWGPLNGVMIHHTASGSGSGIESYVSAGSDELPGPLCQALIEKDGTVILIGWGRANHAGGGDKDVLDAVIAERWPTPKPDVHNGSAGAVDGNARFVGYECVNRGDGKDPWPDVQLEAIARASAAVCRFYGWSVDSVIRHLDWSDWKSDPKGVDWDKMRSRIAAVLKGKPNATPFPGTTPVAEKPKIPVVSLANLIKAYRTDPAAPQGHTTYPADVKPVEAALLKLGFLDRKYAADGSFGTRSSLAYNAFRRSIGLRGNAALGDPGRQSLSILGSRSGLFTVK